MLVDIEWRSIRCLIISFLEKTDLAARARILGPSEVYVKRGSTISLSCMVNVHTTTVSW